MKFEHKGSVVEETGGYEVLECMYCGFKHLNPLPSPEVLDEFYKKQYYDSHKTDYISNQLAEEEYLSVVFKERLEFLAKYSRDRDILDIGCGAGAFLNAAQKSGWNSFGVEPSDLAVNKALETGIKVFNGTFDEFYVSNQRTFDVVQLKNVLEHVPDPIDMLRKCYQILKSGGVLYVEVPNDYDLIQRCGVKIVGERNHWVSIPDHINYFNFKSLKKLVGKLGFKIIKLDTTFPMYIFLWIGKNFISDKKIGSEVNKKRIAFEMFFYWYKLTVLKNIIYTCLAKIGLGRTVILYCRKP